MSNTPSRQMPPDFPAQTRSRFAAIRAANGTLWSIPDPSTRFVRTLALHVFEALHCTRSIAQLSSAISVAAARDLATQRAVLREREAMYHDVRREAAIPGRLHLSRTNERCAEAAVVLHMKQRACVLTFSFEWVHGRWRACEIWLL